LTDDDVVFIFSECDSNIYDVIYVGFGLFFCLMWRTMAKMKQTSWL